jgi:sugar transferase (PEP-CTERM/EpsH1 system associated)
MKILYIAHRIPYPPNKGDKIRAFHQVEALAKQAEVFLCALVDDPEDWQHQAALKEICPHVTLVALSPHLKKVLALLALFTGSPMSVKYFHENKLQHEIDKLLADHVFDAIICFSGTSAEYIFRSKSAATLFSRRRPHPALIMDFCDVDSLKWLEYGQRSKFPLSLLYKVEGQLLARYEKKITKNFDHAILITENEKQLFVSNVFSSKKLTVIENGVDTDYFSPTTSLTSSKGSHEKSLKLLFVGAMDYQANIDGVCWFAEAVWPSIINKYPQASFTIVGRNPTQTVLNLQKQQNIQVTGEVPDVRPYYEQATIVVVPLRIARGIQNKVLEAMAMARPVIVSRAAFMGLKALPEKEILIADSAQNFLDETFRLLEDHKLRDHLAEKSRQCVETNYSWSSNMRLFSNLIS